MKKKRIRQNLCRGCMPKFLLKMKLLSFFILVSAITTLAANSYSQQTKFNISFRSATVQEVLQKIEDSSEFIFLYSEKSVDVDRKVDVNVTNQTVDVVLDQLFNGTRNFYEIRNRQISILEKGSTENSYLKIGTESSQQQKSISGKVTDSSGASLPGVSVVVKGTTTGIITDMDGKYTIVKVPANATLQFSFVGMKTQEVAIGSKTTINITLAEDAIGIEEVVAIGYGTKSKETLTGAISVIDDKVLTNRSSAKTTDLLQGVSSGLQITRNNTGNIRNSTNNITIRGVTSRNAPGVLVVIDGVTQASTNSTALDNINPDDIESISVLKDGQAAIYGARAAGGVILITTKKGKSDKPTINFSSNYTIQSPSLMRKPSNILEMVEMHNEGYIRDGQLTNAYTPVVKYIADNNITFSEIAKNNGKHVMTAPFGLAYALGNYDWNDIMFNPSPMINSNISISGKNDKLNYYESISYLNQDGMLAYGLNYDKRLLITLKNDYTVNNFLKVISNFKIGNQKVVEPYNWKKR